MQNANQSTPSLPNRWGNLPSLEELGEMHIGMLIEEMADIREEVGYYRRLRKKPGLWPENMALLNNLIRGKKKELDLIQRELKELRNGKTTDQGATGRIPGGRQGYFQF